MVSCARPVVAREIEEAMRTKTPSEWVDHTGDPLSKRLNFFVDPPEEIGTIQSAMSSLPKGKEPWSAAFRFNVALAVTLIGMALGIVLDIVAGVESWVWRCVWVGVGTLLGLLIGTAIENFKHWVTYVGDEGIARFIHTGNPAKIKAEVLPFADAADIRVSRTHYENIIDKQAGRQTGYTTYYFEWLNDKGKSLMTVSYRDHGMGEKKFRPEANFYHFGNAAEKAWTAYKLAEARRQLKAGETLRFRRFPLLLGDWVELGKDTLSFGSGKKKKDEWLSDELAEVEVDRKKGVIRFRHIQAKKGWLSSKGIYEVPFGDLANAELFLKLLREFHGQPAPQ
jgi:hypothetical protein